jgi:hypothetical protein
MANGLKNIGFPLKDWSNLFLQTGLSAVWILLVFGLIKVITWIFNISV